MASKKLADAVVFVLAVVLCAASASGAQELTGSVHVAYGLKALSGAWEDDLTTLGADLSQQESLGLSLNLGRDTWPVQIAAYVSESSKKDDPTHPRFGRAGLSIEGRTQEVGLGVRKLWQRGSVTPFVGAGVASLKAEQKGVSVGTDTLWLVDLEFRSSDSTIGAWVDGGFAWWMGRHFCLGAAARFSYADSIELFKAEIEGGQSFDAGGLTAMAFVGFGW